MERLSLLPVVKEDHLKAEEQMLRSLMYLENGGPAFWKIEEFGSISLLNPVERRYIKALFLRMDRTN